MANGVFSLVATIPGEDTLFNDSGVFNQIGYDYYMVSVSDFNVESYPSDTVFAYPHSPERAGILVVNGVDWATYGSEITNFYQNRSVTGFFPYQFWDLFEPPPPGGRPFPETVLGAGDFPIVLFDAFATIIWVGNNFNGDFITWDENQGHIMNFLDSDGNLFLLCRMGDQFLFPALQQYAHITNLTPNVNPAGLHAVYDPLTDIQRLGSHSFTCYVDVDTAFTRVLYRPLNDDFQSAGIWLHSDLDGDFVYLAGRPYRHNNAQLRANCEIILGRFLGMTSARDNETQLPQEITLFQNHPNPFNPDTKIKFGLPLKTALSLKVYDILGRRVATLANGVFDAGYHEIVWNGKNENGENIASGIYLYRLETQHKAISRKMVILK
jgi:hypothetical protein